MCKTAVKKLIILYRPKNMTFLNFTAKIEGKLGKLPSILGGSSWILTWR
jgi:hypothetical protein